MNKLAMKAKPKAMYSPRLPKRRAEENAKPNSTKDTVNNDQ